MCLATSRNDAADPVRCPFSLERMVNVADDGKVVYRAGKGVCHPFPIQGDVNLKAGTKSVA